MKNKQKIKEDKRKTKRPFFDKITPALFLSGLLGMGTALGFLIGSVFDYFKDKNKYIILPKVEKVQQGYVVPSKLEMKLTDLDKNKEYEVIMNYDGKSYLFRLDKQNRPVVKDYELKIPKPEIIIK